MRTAEDFKKLNEEYKFETCDKRIYDLIDELYAIVKENKGQTRIFLDTDNPIYKKYRGVNFQDLKMFGFDVHDIDERVNAYESEFLGYEISW